MILVSKATDAVCAIVSAKSESLLSLRARRCSGGAQGYPPSQALSCRPRQTAPIGVPHSPDAKGLNCPPKASLALASSSPLQLAAPRFPCVCRTTRLTWGEKGAQAAGGCDILSLACVKIYKPRLDQGNHCQQQQGKVPRTTSFPSGCPGGSERLETVQRIFSTFPNLPLRAPYCILTSSKHE